MSCQLRGQKGVRAFLNGGMKNVKTMMHSAKVITLNARRALTLPRAAQHVRRRIIVAFVTSCQQKQYSLSFRPYRCCRMMLLLLLLYDRCPQCALTTISSFPSPSHLFLADQLMLLKFLWQRSPLGRPSCSLL